MFNINKKIFIYLSLIIWPFFALITLLNLKTLLLGQCSFSTSWPFCTSLLSVQQNMLQFFILLLTFSVLVFGGKYLMQHLLLDKKKITKGVGLFLILSVFFSVFILPFTSNDLNYYFDVGATIEEGINPYTQDRATQNNYIFDSEKDSANGVMYGPITVALFQLFYKISQGNIFLFALLFKIFILITFFTVSILTWVLIKDLNIKINKNIFFIFFLTQPLVIWEWVVNGHFDGLWLIFVLLSILFANKGKWWLVITCLTMGIWIKFIPLLMVPWFALWWWQGLERGNYKKNILEIIVGIILSIFTTIFVWFKYWSGLEVFEAIAVQSKWAVNSLFSVLYYSFRPVFEFLIGQNYHWYLTRVLHLVLLVFLIYMVYPYIKKAFLILSKKIKLTPIEYIQAIFVTMLLYLFIWQKSFWPWYVVWLLPLGLILLSKNKYINKIFIYISLVPLLFYIPWMATATNAHKLWFFYYAVGLVMIYPLFQLYKWRKKDYAIVE